MSWQAYIDSSLVGTGNVDSAAIFSNNGKDNWAHSIGFVITPEEMNVIVDSLNDQSKIFGTGFKVNGDKYTVIRADDTTLLGKKGKEGFVVTKTKQALILAHHDESVQTQTAASTVQALGDYLVAQGY